MNAFSYIKNCLLYTSDAADERSSVDLGGRRIIKKTKKKKEEEIISVIPNNDIEGKRQPNEQIKMNI